MFRVRLTDFRCFADTSPLEVRPITFLVGENSTGKTTFLAALRHIMESFSRSPQNPFNREPYFLGGFDQIARYRGGRGGRAKSFSIELDVPASSESAVSAQKGRRQSATTRHEFTFSKGATQPDLSGYSFFTMRGSLGFDLVDPPSVKVSIHGGPELTLTPDDERLPPLAILKHDLSILPYVIQEMIPRREPTEGHNWGREVEMLVRSFRESMRFVTRRTFASAPVRTQPRRTYTPSEIAPSSEGSHVPVEMARQKITSRTEWGAVREKLVTFGRDSGLFEDIDIRLLGKRDGDPFQVLVKTQGPRVNLVDVGYGVSQVLPIIYQLGQSRPYEVYLLQQPEVHLHPKAQAGLGSLVSELSQRQLDSVYVIETHSDYVIDRVRTEVSRGALDSRRVTIIFFERLGHEVRATNIYLNERGEIEDAPDNFRSFFLEEHARLLGL